MDNESPRIWAYIGAPDFLGLSDGSMIGLSLQRYFDSNSLTAAQIFDQRATNGPPKELRPSKSFIRRGSDVVPSGYSLFSEDSSIRRKRN